MAASAGWTDLLEWLVCSDHPNLDHDAGEKDMDPLSRRLNGRRCSMEWLCDLYVEFV